MCVLVTVLLTMQRPWGHSVSHGTEEVAESSSFWWEGRRKRGRERDSMGFWNPKAHSTYFLQQGHTSQSFQIVPHPGDQFAILPQTTQCGVPLHSCRDQRTTLWPPLHGDQIQVSRSAEQAPYKVSHLLKGHLFTSTFLFCSIGLMWECFL